MTRLGSILYWRKIFSSVCFSLLPEVTEIKRKIKRTGNARTRIFFVLNLENNTIKSSLTTSTRIFHNFFRVVWLAQLVVYQTSVREVAGSNPR